MHQEGKGFHIILSVIDAKYSLSVAHQYKIMLSFLAFAEKFFFFILFLSTAFQQRDLSGGYHNFVHLLSLKKENLRFSEAYAVCHKQV